MSSPFVSIIIPIFNVEAYLYECLSSIFAIKGLNIEAILIDDGSTDKSYDIAESFRSRYPHKTNLIRRDNEGVSAARNAGLKAATGDWIAFLDSDDFVDPNAFSRILLHADQSTSDVIAFDGNRLVQETQKTLPLYTKENPFILQGKVKSREYLSTCIKLNMTNVVTIWNKIYRRSVLVKANITFIDGILHEDVAFTFEVLLNDLPIEFVNEHAIYYRQRKGSIMYTPSALKLESNVFVINHLLNTYQMKKLTDVVLNDYLVFKAKIAILQGSKIDRKILDRLRKLKLSVKKRVMLYSLYLSR